MPLTCPYCRTKLIIHKGYCQSCWNKMSVELAALIINHRYLVFYIWLQRNIYLVSYAKHDAIRLNLVDSFLSNHGYSDLDTQQAIAIISIME